MSNILIKDLPILERPRERLYKYGVNSLSNEELLSIILKTGYKNRSVRDLSEKLLKEVKDINSLKDISINKLLNIKGIGKVKAITLIASIELGKRVYEQKDLLRIKLDSSKNIFDYIKKDLLYKKQEFFYCIYLDSKKYLIEKKLLFVGTLNKSIVHPREVFKYAYLLSADSIICVHNHPTGDILPSKDDILFTNKLIEIGKINGINVIDHIIIGNNNYYSFYDNNDM